MNDTAMTVTLFCKKCAPALDVREPVNTRSGFFHSQGAGGFKRHLLIWAKGKTAPAPTLPLQLRMPHTNAAPLAGNARWAGLRSTVRRCPFWPVRSGERR